MLYQKASYNRDITYSVKKTRARAWQDPEGSGVPVGTEYHWYILADQNIRKLDTNSYATSMAIQISTQKS